MFLNAPLTNMPHLSRVFAVTWKKYDKTELISAEDMCLAIQGFRDEVNLSRSYHERLLAAVEFAIPRLKGQLCEVRQALKGRLRTNPTKHTIPNTKSAASLFAADLASKGVARMGAAHVVQTETGLRPSELLGLKSSHMRRPSSAKGNIVLRLGAHVSTTAKREQFIIVSPERQQYAWKLLGMLGDICEPEEYLFPYSYWEYRHYLALVDNSLGVNLGITPHSGRAGFATESVLAEVPLPEIQAAGRWLSESSFKSYVDIVGALGVQTAFRMKGLQKAADFCQAFLFKCLTFESLATARPAHLVKHGTKQKRVGRQTTSFAEHVAEREQVPDGRACGISTHSKGKERLEDGAVGRHAFSKSVESPAAATDQSKRTSQPGKGKGKSKGCGRSSLSSRR